MFDSFNENGFGPGAGRYIGGAGEGFGGASSFFGEVSLYQRALYHAAAPDGSGDGPQFFLNGDDRGTFGSNGKPSLLPGDAGSQITRTGLSWATGLGQPATVTFAFRGVAPASMPSDTAGFTQFNSLQISAALLAMAAWSEVANITFQRVTDPGSQYSNNATILFGNYSSGSDGAAAFAFLPGSTASSGSQGDVWVNSSLSYNATPVIQQYGQQVLTHEIGHAIGLSHPAAYNASADGVITYGADAIYYEDSRQYTIMSYFSERETGADFRTNGAGASRYSAAPLMDDIAAAQRLYGANMTTRTGDTTYGFNSTAGQPWFNANQASSPLIFCVWDAGGVDTLDFSGYTTDNQTIDLRQGCFSSVGGLVGNVSIAIGAVIERAVGGSGLDNFIGNSADNRISTGGGSGSVDGGLGSDTVVFTGARAEYTVSYNGRVATVTHNAGLFEQNIISNVEFLAFSDQTMTLTASGGMVLAHGDATNDTINGSGFLDWLAGGAGNDVIHGFAGQNSLLGEAGDDVLIGGDDVDFLVGGIGDDTLDGGGGIDTVDYGNYDESGEGVVGAVAAVNVDLSLGFASGGAGNDTLSHIENVTGTAWDDMLTGDDAANVLNGGGGVDTLSGGGGDDTLLAGPPGQTGGAPDIVKAQGTANATIGAAVSLAGGFDLGNHAGVANANTIPHATVVATTHGGVEYYAITVVAGDTVTFDIDNATFDSTLRLFDAGGNPLAKNDDSASDGGNETDSGLTYTFAAGGTYYIQVAEWAANQAGGEFTSQPPGAGQTYTLNVSVPSATTTPLTLTGSTMFGEAGADTLTGGAGRDTLYGGDDNDTLTGGAGDDLLEGGAGTDTAVMSGNRSAYTFSTSGGVTTLTGPDGTDTLTTIERIQFADGLYDIAGNPVSAVNVINGTPNADTLNGTSGADQVDAGAGDDTINAGAGNDTIDGGLGLDVAVFSGVLSGYTVSTVGGVTTVTGPDGTDTLTNVERLKFADATLIVGANGGQYIVGTANADTLAGTTGDDLIEAGASDDLITGGTGNDTIDGGQGADTAVFSGALSGYTVSTVGGTTTVTGPDGVDSLTNVERLKFADATLIVGAGGGQYFAGTAGADTITGTAFNDQIDGGAGGDTLTGGGGNDLIDGGSGTDVAVFSGARSSYTISALGGGTYTVSGGGDGADTLRNVERLRFSDGNYDMAGNLIVNRTINGDAAANHLVGGLGNDFIDGHGGNDLMEGGDGDDIYVVGEPGDRVVEAVGEGHDTVYTSINFQLTAGSEIEILSTRDWGATTAIQLRGNEFSNELYGNAGANYLDGSEGADLMYGFGGDDTYVVDNAADRVREAQNEGYDRVFTSVNYSLESGIYVELLSVRDWSSTTNLQLVGNSLANEIYGNAGDNFLDGLGGADVLYGFGGDDTYVIENAGDRVIENAGEGYDRIFTSVDYSLESGIYVELLSVRDWSSTTNIQLVGNDLANEIYGNAGANFIDGLGGADLMYGFAGNDVYVVDNAGDRVVEAVGQGTDFVFTTVSFALEAGSSVELLSARDWGSTTNLRLTGNEQANELHGNAGANVLDGGAGADYMTGEAGADTFAFTTALGGGNVDTIIDFHTGQDKIYLSNAVFTGLAAGALAATAFASGTQAADADDRIIYDAATGNLWFDSDGTGAAAQVYFGRLVGGVALIASDFQIGAGAPAGAVEPIDKAAGGSLTSPRGEDFKLLHDDIAQPFVLPALSDDKVGGPLTSPLGHEFGHGDDFIQPSVLPPLSLDDDSPLAKIEMTLAFRAEHSLATGIMTALDGSQPVSENDVMHHWF